MSKDLLDDRYGRFREIPLVLARRGHEVRGICMSYRYRPDRRAIDQKNAVDGTVVWDSINLGSLIIPGLIRYIGHVRRVVREFTPDVVWSASDIFQGLIGQQVARATGAAHVFDLYDNFESYRASHLPGLRAAYRAAVRRADGVTCVSEPLQKKITGEYRRTGPVLVLPNGIDQQLFRPKDRKSCRRQLGLPTDAQLIGVAGAISRSRGIETVFEAAAHIMRERNNVHLVVAGPRDRGLALPDDPRVHDLGILPHTDVPALINALDVALIPNRESEFGDYCFPQKAYEYLACQVPVAVSDVGAMHALFAECPQSRFRAGDVADLVRALGAQLDHPCRVSTPARGWDELGAGLDTFLRQITSPQPPAAL